MRKYPRIEIDHKAYDGLQIEAVLKNKTVREIATNIILGNISKEALRVLDHKTYSNVEPNELSRPEKPASQPSTQAGRPRQLARDKTAVALIKELWISTDLSITDIAQQTDAPRQTVDGLIKRLIAKGELAQRAESGEISGKKV